MDAIPNSIKPNNSSDCETPSWLISRQTLTLPKSPSSRSKKPSLFSSKWDSASNPEEALIPPAIKVSAPNSSPPLSMRPFLFLSSTRRPSSPLTQPVPVRTPSPSWSNNMLPDAPTVSIPSPSRSNVRGSRLGTNLRASLKLRGTSSLIGRGSIKSPSLSESQPPHSSHSFPPAKPPATAAKPTIAAKGKPTVRPTAPARSTPPAAKSSAASSPVPA
ncbi:hypothetical protein CFBP7900_09270 [Xanthomonas hortorum pv. carotae]|uniref:Uncharacterized protein n=1 Tax=Xanthomonas hortorum pv. carotae TaxID=487904 RepID=A0A6V7CDH9_9XANT|nr:hypothetical protein CFBP7900_09270 [Xanthomonas hortorum pv. carotae]CAD0313601.1 hypothetical protein CFBP7900_09270 [Xanthomonas hortorum pv. carotae]